MVNLHNCAMANLHKRGASCSSASGDCSVTQPQASRGFKTTPHSHPTAAVMPPPPPTAPLLQQQSLPAAVPPAPPPVHPRSKSAR